MGGGARARVCVCVSLGHHAVSILCSCMIRGTQERGLLVVSHHPCQWAITIFTLHPDNRSPVRARAIVHVHLLLAACVRSAVREGTRRGPAAANGAGCQLASSNPPVAPCPPALA